MDTSPFELYVLPSSLLHLTFGGELQDDIGKYLPNGLTHLKLGYSCYQFNEMVHQFPPSLIYLEFCDDFNQPLESLPSTLRHLKFGKNFNQKVDHVLPPNITYLKFGDKFSHCIFHLLPPYCQVIFSPKYRKKLPGYVGKKIEPSLAVSNAF